MSASLKTKQTTRGRHSEGGSSEGGEGYLQFLSGHYQALYGDDKKSSQGSSPTRGTTKSSLDLHPAPRSSTSASSRLPAEDRIRQLPKEVRSLVMQAHRDLIAEREQTWAREKDAMLERLTAATQRSSALEVQLEAQRELTEKVAADGEAKLKELQREHESDLEHALALPSGVQSSNFKELTDRLLSSEQERAAVFLQLSKSEQRCSALEAEVMEARAEGKRALVAQREAARKAARAKEKQHKKALASDKAEVGRLQRELVVVNSARATLQGQKEELVTQKRRWLEQLQAENTQLEAVFADTRAAKEALVAEMNNLATEKSELESERNALYMERQDLLSRSAALPPPAHSYTPAPAAAAATAAPAAIPLPAAAAAAPPAAPPSPATAPAPAPPAAAAAPAAASAAAAPVSGSDAAPDAAFLAALKVEGVRQLRLLKALLRLQSRALLSGMAAMEKRMADGVALDDLAADYSQLLPRALRWDRDMLATATTAKYTGATPLHGKLSAVVDRMRQLQAAALAAFQSQFAAAQREPSVDGARAKLAQVLQAALSAAGSALPDDATKAEAEALVTQQAAATAGGAGAQ